MYVPIAVKEVLTFYLFSSTLVGFVQQVRAHSCKCVMVWPCTHTHTSLNVLVLNIHVGPFVLRRIVCGLASEDKMRDRLYFYLWSCKKKARMPDPV